MKPTLRQIQLPGRVQLEFAEQGERSGTPVILLHGVTDSWRSFEPVLPHLPPDLRVMALSQRGHGGSDKPAGGYRPADFAADVVAFMDVMAIERAVLVGHSMGSINALRCAIDHPSRVAGLLLAGTMPWFGRPPELLEFYREQIVPLVEPVPDALARDFQLSTLARPIAGAMS
jgi:pimeloyl-ACP methyl ester carboxylesterase